MQSLLRRPMLALAERETIEQVVRQSRLARGLVRRFVAGDTLDDALTVARQIAAMKMTTTLDLLGENVVTVEAARSAATAYADILRRMAADGLEPNISVKLTMLGLDLGESVTMETMASLLAVAREVRGFVRIDMEGSPYTARTLDIAERLHDRDPDQVGAVIQSYLFRSPDDVERLIGRGMRVRLVKGAYAEPASIAYQGSDAVDAAYRRLMEWLLDAGTYPAIATHDPSIIRVAQGYARRMGISPDRFEFQMLYGVRRDEQAALTEAGYRVRVYIPYGTEWYPYFARRIAERPANALFVLRQLVRG